MKNLVFAVPLLALAACESADDATLNKTAVDTDTIVETESAAAVNDAVAEQQAAEQMGADERNSVGF